MPGTTSVTSVGTAGGAGASVFVQATVPSPNVKKARIDFKRERMESSVGVFDQGVLTILPLNFCCSMVRSMASVVTLLASYSMTSHSLLTSTSICLTPLSPYRASLTLFGQVFQTRLSRSVMPSTCSVTSRGSGLAGGDSLGAGVSLTTGESFSGGSPFGSVLVEQLARRITQLPKMKHQRQYLNMSCYPSGLEPRKESRLPHLLRPQAARDQVPGPKTDHERQRTPGQHSRQAG